jgi:hypothetical protein
MKLHLFAWLSLSLGLLAVTCRATPSLEIVPLDHDTFELTRSAKNKFTHNVAKLRTQALEDATAYCAKLHKELKVVSITDDEPTIPFTRYIKVKIVFKALDANDPELHVPVLARKATDSTPLVVENAAPQTETDALYKSLNELDDLRKRGLLTEDEFQAKRKKLVEKSN